MKQFLILPSIIILLLSGCKEETELQKSVFIPDVNYPELPLYSEWGYNTFGAYYDREAFISNNHEVPVKVVVTGNKTSFIFKGQKGATNYNSDSYTEMSMTFKIDGFLPEDYIDLIVLNDTKLDLTNPNYSVVVSIDTAEYEAYILNGEFEFKRAQNLLVDKKQIEVILSGYFEFQALINEEPVTISNGRFDVGIGMDNFYNY